MIHLLSVGDYGSGIGAAVLVALVVVTAGVVYFLPLVVAVSRGTQNEGAVGVVNLFLGWTFIGWVIALAMAAGGTPKPKPAASVATNEVPMVRGGDPLGGACVPLLWTRCRRCRAGFMKRVALLLALVACIACSRGSTTPVSHEETSVPPPAVNRESGRDFVEAGKRKFRKQLADSEAAKAKAESDKAAAEALDRKKGVAVALAYTLQLKKAGILKRFNIPMNEGWVDPLRWGLLPYDRKEQIALALATACESDGGSGWVTIRDNQSGKELAKYGAWGFQVYD